MLRLESYLSPFLFSYLSKYIKNIEPKDLQLSLWGGDAVLHNLQFKLDALDNELGKAPFSFVCCQAEELKIHVPWSKLASECVVVTLNTVECVVKLNCNKTLNTTTTTLKDEPPVQPSYVNSLIKKIKNNLNLIVNNLIIKYVEDDVVLSVNIQSATYQGVDELWRPAFVELTEADPVLRRIWELKDVTVCLDKRGASGRVESLEDPLLFRTHFTFREHNVYPSPTSRKPLATKINLLVNRYELNISENQLPLFLHLLELCFYLYYGKIDVSFQEINAADNNGVENVGKQGWASWAWSYVPPVLNYEVEEDKVQSPIFSFAIYMKMIVIKLKPSRAEPFKQFHHTQSESDFRPLLEVSAEGFDMKLVVKGLEFFSCVTSICNGSIRFLGGVPLCLNGQALPCFSSDSSILLASGGGSMFGFAADSLFDFRSPENNGILFDYPLTKDSFFASKSENSLDNIFFSQYLYIAADGRDTVDSEAVQFNDYLKTALLNDVDEWNKIHEQSWKEFYFGGESCKLELNSYMLLCIDILQSWASNHNIKPYSLASPEKITSKVLPGLAFIPTRSAYCCFRNIEVSVTALCLQTSPTYQEKVYAQMNLFDSSNSKLHSKHTNKNDAYLPTVVISCPYSEITMIQPMYGMHLAASLANYVSPLPNLVKACTTKYEANVSVLNVFLSCTQAVASEINILSSQTCPILSLKQFFADYMLLQGKEFWEKRTTMIQSKTNIKFQQLLAEVTVQQLELLLHIFDSWLSMVQNGTHSTEVIDVCQMKKQINCKNSSYCHVSVYHFSCNTRETFANMSLCSCIAAIDVYWQFSLDYIIPIMQCTSFSQPMHTPEQFLQTSNDAYSLKPSDKLLEWDDSTYCLSFYTQLPYLLSGNGCVLLNIQQLFVSIDPYLNNIISQIPSVPIYYLMPCLFPTSRKENNIAPKDQPTLIQNMKSKFAVQIISKGGQLLFLTESHPCLLETYKKMPAVHVLRSCILQSTTKVLCISFPTLTANTGGFKPVQISSKLLAKSISVNKFTQFERLNLGLENASVYALLTNKNTNPFGELIVKPCTAACTIVFKELKESKVNIALHVDLESISIELAQNKVALFVQVLNSVLQVVDCLQKNYKSSTQLLVKHSASENLTESNTNEIAESKVTMDQQGEKADVTKTSSGISWLAHHSPARKNLPFVLWMQCTLPRVTLSFHCSKDWKILLFIDDVSMSLDCQSVYLKLMMSLSTCNIAQWTKLDEEWVKSDAFGLMLNPMFSIFPSFLQKFSIPKETSSIVKAEPTAKPGKFLDFIFTQALASDYHRSVHEGLESGDQASSSTVTAASEPAIASNANISEIICVIQSFDIVLCPKQIASLTDLFLPLLQIQCSQNVSPAASTVQHGIVLPVLYITINGVRLFMPSVLSKEFSDNVLMLCFGKFEINPYPQNPLSRLVVSPMIFKRATSAGMLNFPGSNLEDRQFELTLKDLSLGTARTSDLIVHLKKPISLSENPALRWNMREQLHLGEPVFHPIIEQFDIKITFAPAMYHISQSGKSIMVCGTSLEVGFTSNLIIHVTTMQLRMILELIYHWSDQYQSIIENSIMLQPDLQNWSMPTINNDGGISVSANNQTIERRVQPVSKKFVSDILITGQKVEILLYKLIDDDNDHVCPLLQLKVDEPSFVFHISKLQQKVVLQFHNAVVNASNLEARVISSIHDHNNFPIAFIQTLPGKCNTRTGVPGSLCTLTVDHFLTNKARINLFLGRPIKCILNECVTTSLLNVFNEALFFQALIQSSPSSAVSSSYMQKISSLSFYCSQIVGEIQCPTHIVRCSFTEMNLNIDAVKNSDTLAFLTLSGFSVRMCELQKSFFPLLYPLMVNVSLKYCSSDPSSTLFFKVKVTTLQCAVSAEMFSGLSAVADTLYSWINLFSANSDFNAKASVSKVQKVVLVKLDDIRNGKYCYINTTQEDLIPLPGQIVFSSKLPVSTMSWCYDKPHTLKHVCITPIPFNEILGDGSDILCFLESYDECSGSYKCRKEFYVSETKHIDFALYDDNTPFHEIFFSTHWRVSVHNTDRCHVSPLSLAASMNIEAIYDSSSVPGVAITLEVPLVKISATAAKKEFENVEFTLSHFTVSADMWNSFTRTVKAKVDATLALQALEFHSLTWIPVLLPVPVQIALLQLDAGLNIIGTATQKCEIHISQRIIHSLQYLSALFTTSRHTNPSFFQVENRTAKPILFGQALTDECITLASGAVIAYTWRTTKVEPMLHVSVDGLSRWIWSSPFCPYSQQTVHRAIDDSNSIVAFISETSSHHYKIVLSGSTRISNNLDVDLQACLVVGGVTTYVKCSSKTSAKQEFLFDIKDISTILFKLGDCTASENIFASELFVSPGFTKLISFNTGKATTHAQVYYAKKGVTNIIFIMPLFIVRSYLPNSVILHVETRAKCLTVSSNLPGCGNQVYLQSLSPLATHHLTIQLNENASPFDATIPFHFSLKDTLSENEDVDVENLVKCYPFNSVDYESNENEQWSAGDGSIQAKLSLQSKAVLVEIVPWCLICNKTSMVFCITSPDDCVSIVQANQTITLHHFSGLFNIRSSNTCSSEWLTLTVNPELDHPSRVEKLKLNHLPVSGYRVVVLKTGSSLVELVLRSTVHHGVRVVTLLPRWNFVNLVDEMEHLQILPCVSEQLISFKQKDCLLNSDTNCAIPLLCWRTVIEQESVAETTTHKEVDSVSVESTIEKTSSSFLCVEKAMVMPIHDGRVLCLKTLQTRTSVSVKEGFTKKIVEFYSSSNRLLHRQMILTKHDHHGCFFLVLSNIKKEKYLLQNLSDTTLYLRECDDGKSDAHDFVLYPNSIKKLESSLDAEIFPMCLRKFRTLHFQIRAADQDSWTDMLLSAKESKKELLLSNAFLLYINVLPVADEIQINISNSSDFIQHQIKKSSFNCSVALKELQVALMDDTSNLLYSVDVVQMLFDDIVVKFLREQAYWVIELSVFKFQVDNQLYPETDFPVFLSSVAENGNCFFLSVILNDRMLLDKFEALAEVIELHSDGEFLQSLSRLLQSYLAHSLTPDKSTNAIATTDIPEEVRKEVDIYTTPLRCKSIVIRPITVILSVRASMKLSLSIDRGAVTFAKFVCRNVDTTFHEIVQELTRHYFAEAVYGAGWVLGSVDLLGNPASTFRSYVKGISDFIVMPYKGMKIGPTAFFGGFTRGVASLLRHFSAGTLRSVTNIASGISRNLYSGSEKQHHSGSQSPMKVGTTFEESVFNEKEDTKQPSTSYMSGVTKALVGVVTKPIGGAAGLVSRTGETILRKAGLEEEKSVRYGSLSHALSFYHNSLTKYARKIIRDDKASILDVVSLDCQIICLNGVSFTAALILSPTTLYIFQLVDDILETAILVDEISLHLEKNQEKDVYIISVQGTGAKNPAEKNSSYNEKVANYLGVNSFPQSNRSTINRHVKYTAELKCSYSADVFMAYFELVKQSANKFDW